MGFYDGEYADTPDGAIRLFVFWDVAGWTFRAYSLQEHRWLLGQEHASSLAEGKNIAEQWASGVENISAEHALQWRRNN